MFEQVINEFRQSRGYSEVKNWNSNLSYNCHLHSLAMSKVRGIYHTEECYLENNQEAVAITHFSGEPFINIVRQIVFDLFGHSIEHARVLLECNEMGVGYVIDNYNIYVTIRGKV